MMRSRKDDEVILVTTNLRLAIADNEGGIPSKLTYVREPLLHPLE